MNWQLSTGSWLPIRIQSRTLNWQLSTGSQLPIPWRYHKVYTKWIGNCQLAASCQFDKATIRDIWNELATVNWQLAANSNSVQNFERISFCVYFNMFIPASASFNFFSIFVICLFVFAHDRWISFLYLFFLNVFIPGSALNWLHSLWSKKLLHLFSVASLI